MLIHATFTISGEPLSRTACEASLRRLLSPHYLRGEVTEHHGPNALCYDFKVEGGVPFPAFAQASQEFPDLSFAAEWVNVAAGERGNATIVNGRVTQQSGERVPTRAADACPVHVEVAPDGRLILALVVLRVAREEWRGYALTPGGDALLLARRGPDGAVELSATEGAAEWAVRWSGRESASGYDFERLDPPVLIEEASFRELEAVLRQFVSDWIWFAGERREDIAIESERYGRYGYPVAAANVRSALLRRLLADAAPGGAAAHSTLGAEDRWVKDLVLATWAGMR
jgi:hypothetical protein